uniref:uncharacterized protein LOC122587792 n=1 Tax=Erigeron canadensis TaxID=72917 RepID=UPI001CB89774|nr:uncharacterized protein LOC122587792 [Erigeron canadensis]
MEQLVKEIVSTVRLKLSMFPYKKTRRLERFLDAWDLPIRLACDPTNSSQAAPAIPSSVTNTAARINYNQKNKNNTTRPTQSKNKGPANQTNEFNEVPTRSEPQNTETERAERSSFYDKYGNPDPFNLGSEEAARNIIDKDMPNSFEILQKLIETVKENQEYTKTQFKILESRIIENGPPITPRNLFSTPPTSAPPGFATTDPIASRNFGSNIPQNTQAAGTSANAGSGLPNANDFIRSFGFTNPLQEQGENEYIAREIQKIKEMISSVPGFFNPIPEVNPASYLINRYGDRIATVEIPKKFQMPNMKPYDGTVDPQEHIALYLEKMETVPIPHNLKEACLCRSFGSTLSGSALKWLQSLPPRSIKSFADLTNLFYSQFSCSRTFEKLTDDLYKITQKQHESLRDFMTRFTKESLNIPKLDMLTAIQALQRGLHQGSKFQKDLIMTPYRNLDEAKARAARFIRLEENELTTAKLEALSYDRLNRKTETPVFKQRHKPYIRHVHNQINAVEEEEGTEYPALSTYRFTVGIPGLIMALRNLGDKVRWPQKKNNDGYFKKTDTSQWCAYHEDFGHVTEDCKMLRREICILLSKGYLTELMGRKKAKDIEGMDLTKPKPTQKADSPPANAKVINTISGGSEVCGSSYSAAKRFAKQNKAEKREKSVKKASISYSDTISFEDDDFDDVIEPHHDGF